MRFWDTSALMHLVVRQARHAEAERWLSEDGLVAAWTLTQIEMLSAVHRLAREGQLDGPTARATERSVADVMSRAHLVSDVRGVKTRAQRLLRTHALRAADALQLAAALAWASDQPSDRVLHTFDARLGRAAEREGFRVIPDA